MSLLRLRPCRALAGRGQAALVIAAWVFASGVHLKAPASVDDLGLYALPCEQALCKILMGRIFTPDQIVFERGRCLQTPSSN